MSDSIGRVLSIGETLVDLSARPGDRPGTYTAHPGGSPLNVAVGLSRLGVPVSFASPAALDGFADDVHAFLRDEGVDLTYAPRVSPRTTIAAALLRDGEPRYSFYPEPAPPGAFRIAHLIRPGDFAITHAGSIGLLEPDIYDTAQELFARGDGIRTFDPNVRADLVDDLPAFIARTEALISRSSVLKVSVEDLDLLAPHEDAPDAAARYLALGCESVVVTAAQHGATAYGPWGRVHAPVSGLPVVDTTGGGDATMTALIAVIARAGLPGDGEGWSRALGFAMHVSGITCTRPGGAEAMPSAGELAG